MGPKSNSQSSRRNNSNNSQADDESDVASLPGSLSRPPTDHSLSEMFKQSPAQNPQSSSTKPFDPNWTIDEWKKEIVALAQVAFIDITRTCREQSRGFAKDEDHYKVVLFWEREPSGTGYYYADLWTGNCGNLVHVFQVVSSNEKGFQHVLKHLFLEVTKEIRKVTKSMRPRHSEIY